MPPRIAAIVVTYNRPDYLRRCIYALVDQTVPELSIIVVDNCSDSPTQAVLAEFPGVTTWRSTENLGGAGGFSLGVRHAIDLGFDFLWLMDDDTAPEADALESLLLAQKSVPHAGFIAPLVVTDDSDGRVIPTHLPSFIAKRSVQASNVGSGLVAVSHATFVGVLVSVSAASVIPPPIASYFIWHDDLEYTSRLARESGGYFTYRARVRHPAGGDRKDLAWRLRYAVRNAIWLQRSSGPTLWVKLRVVQETARTLLRHFRASANPVSDTVLVIRSIIEGFGPMAEGKNTDIQTPSL